MILNAQIVNTNLSEEGISFEFGFEFNGTTGSAYLPMPFSTDSIKAMLNLVEVKIWEMLKGQYVRIEAEGDEQNYKMTRIGNIVRDKWIDLSDNTSSASETEEVQAEVVSE